LSNAVTDPLTLVRSVHFAATVLAVGTVSFLVLVAEPANTKVRADFVALRHQLNVLTWLALAVAILSGAAWLVLLASDILGAPLVDICLHGGAWPLMFETRFGLVWCVRLALALLLGLLILRPVTRNFQLAAAIALIASPALVGHAGATPGMAGNLHLVSDMVHLLAAGAWLGGLPAFALLLWRARRMAEPACLRREMSAYDPKRTLAVHCGNGFDAGFSPYQSTRLNRYDAVS
jgi:putative copper resistance protein D